ADDAARGDARCQCRGGNPLRRHGSDGRRHRGAVLRDRRDRRAHVADLPRELGLPDLVLTQILFIVGLPWVGVAAKQGPSHILLWLGGILLFYIPSAFVVLYLHRAMPLEGGLYQWAKLGLNDIIGFMPAWNLWLFAIL